MMNAVQTQERLLYLYGIIQYSRELPVVPQPVEPIVHGKLVALVESVPASEFAPEVLETQFASLEWVARRAERHEALVEAAMQYGPVIPARFCTLFSGSEAVRKVLSEDEERLSGTLAKLDGMREWSIRAYCDSDVLARVVAEGDAKCQMLAEMAANSTPGQGYVWSKRRQTHIQQLADKRKNALQDFILDKLDEEGFEVQVKQLVTSGTLPPKTEMVINLVVLAGNRALPRLTALLEDAEKCYGAEGFAVERTGPWPPYSFTQVECTLDEDNDDDEAGEP